MLYKLHLYISYTMQMEYMVTQYYQNTHLSGRYLFIYLFIIIGRILTLNVKKNRIIGMELD